MPSILGFSSTSSLYLRLGLPTGLSPPNVLYSIFLGMRLLSMRSVCPAYCSRFNLSPADMHGLSYNLCSLLLGYILFFICRFLLLVAIFVSVFFRSDQSIMSILAAFMAFYFCSPCLLGICVYLPVLSQFPNTSFTTAVKVESLLLINLLAPELFFFF